MRLWHWLCMSPDQKLRKRSRGCWRFAANGSMGMHSHAGRSVAEHIIVISACPLVIPAHAGI